MPSYHLVFLFLAFHFFISPICGVNNPNESACSTISALSVYCASATPGWSNYQFPQKAPCLCYDSSAKWKPQVFDGVYSSCANFLKANSVAGASGLPTAPCSAAGDVLARVTHTASVGTPLITSAPSAASSAVGIACRSLLSLESQCESASPGFSRFSSFQQASCLCYSGVKWNPDFYDNIWRSCLNDISTRDTSLYSELKADGITSTPCKAIGEVTQDLNYKSAPTSARPQTSVTSNVPAQTTRTGAAASSTDTTGANLPVNRVGSSITSLITTATSALRAGTSSTSSHTSTKGSSSGTGLPAQSANANGVGSGIELRGLGLLAGLMSASLIAVLFL